MYIEFGRLLKRYREDMKLTLSQLKQELDDRDCPISSRSTIYKWEQGVRPRNLETVEVLEIILNVPDNLLLKATDYPLPSTPSSQPRSTALKSDDKDVSHQAKFDHFKRMAEIAEIMVNRNNLDTVFPNKRKDKPFDKIEYWMGTPTDSEPINAREISDLLGQNYDDLHEEGDYFEADCFISHFNAERPGLKIPDDIDSKTFEIIQTLKILASRKMFKGTCDVCKDM